VIHIGAHCVHPADILSTVTLARGDARRKTPFRDGVC